MNAVRPDIRRRRDPEEARDKGPTKERLTCVVSVVLFLFSLVSRIVMLQCHRQFHDCVSKFLALGSQHTGAKFAYSLVVDRHPRIPLFLVIEPRSGVIAESFHQKISTAWSQEFFLLQLLAGELQGVSTLLCSNHRAESIVPFKWLKSKRQPSDGLKTLRSAR